MNEEEFAQLVRTTGENDPRRPKFWLQWATASKLIIVTRGSEGSELYLDYPRGEKLKESTVPVKVLDTVGAGDAFTAAMVCLHLEGRPLSECARFANHYAARVCEHVGATPRIDRAEVERAAGLSSC